MLFLVCSCLLRQDVDASLAESNPAHQRTQNLEDDPDYKARAARSRSAAGMRSRWGRADPEEGCRTPHQRFALTPLAPAGRSSSSRATTSRSTSRTRSCKCTTSSATSAQLPPAHHSHRASRPVIATRPTRLLRRGSPPEADGHRAAAYTPPLRYRPKFPELESLVLHPIDFARVVKTIGNEMARCCLARPRARRHARQLRYGKCRGRSREGSKGGDN